MHSLRRAQLAPVLPLLQNVLSGSLGGMLLLLLRLKPSVLHDAALVLALPLLLMLLEQYLLLMLLLDLMHVELLEMLLLPVQKLGLQGIFLLALKMLGCTDESFPKPLLHHTSAVIGAVAELFVAASAAMLASHATRWASQCVVWNGEKMNRGDIATWETWHSGLQYHDMQHFEHR